MRQFQLVSAAAVLGVAIAGLAPAAAYPVVEVVEPTSLTLSFSQGPIASPGPAQRIRMTNSGDPVLYTEVLLSGGFQVVASGGDLGQGGEQYWDIACSPDSTEPFFGQFQLNFCTSCGDFESARVIDLSCDGGWLSTPDSIVTMPFVYANQVSEQTVPFTNALATPVTITSVAASTSLITGGPVSGTLPVTLMPGQSLDFWISFDTTGPDLDPPWAAFDLMAGALVADRLSLVASVRNPIEPGYFSYEAMPAGASYTLPLTVRNSATVTRTIASATFDAPGFVVLGAVGATLAPGETTAALLVLTPSVLGRQTGILTLTFDRGAGNTARFALNVVAATFEVTTDDGTATDGWLDFGPRALDDPPLERTFTVTNLTSTPRAILGCDGGSAAYAIVGACPSQLPADGAVTVTVRLTPAAFPDPLALISLQVEGVGNIGVPVHVALSGRRLAASATELDFGAVVVGATAEQTLTIRNLDPRQPVTFTVASVAGAFTADPGAPRELAPGASAALTVRFTPPASGAHTSELALSLVGESPAHLRVPLRGEGLPSPADPPGDGGGGGGGGGCAVADPSAATALVLLLGLVALRRRLCLWPWPRRRRRAAAAP